MTTHACQNGPPRRGRRMSMDTLPPFNKFPGLSPRPFHPLGFPGFPYPPNPFSSLMMQGKSPPSLMPPVFPGLMLDRKFAAKKEEEASSNEVKRGDDSSENNNLQGKGVYGGLDLSVRASNKNSSPLKA